MKQIFTKGVVTAGLALIACASLPAQNNGLDVIKVRPNFYMIAGAGANIGVQIGSDGVVVVNAGDDRALITLLLGVLTLPGLAVYLSFMAGSNPQVFDAASSALIPFVAYAIAALIGGIIIVKIWQDMPIRERKEEAEKEPVLTQAKKEHASHEGSDLNKAA